MHVYDKPNSFSLLIHLLILIVKIKSWTQIERQSTNVQNETIWFHKLHLHVHKMRWCWFFSERNDCSSYWAQFDRYNLDQEKKRKEK